MPRKRRTKASGPSKAALARPRVVCSYCRNALQPNRMCSSCGRLYREPAALAKGQKAKQPRATESTPPPVRAKRRAATRSPVRAKPRKPQATKPVKGRTATAEAKRLKQIRDRAAARKKK